MEHEITPTNTIPIQAMNGWMLLTLVAKPNPLRIEHVIVNNDSGIPVMFSDKKTANKWLFK